MSYAEDLAKYDTTTDPARARFLGRLDQQRAFVFRRHSGQHPCPICQTPNNHYDATGDTYSVDTDYPCEEIAPGLSPCYGPPFACRHCGEPLTHEVYVFGGEGWGTFRTVGQTTRPTPEEVRAEKVRRALRSQQSYLRAHPPKTEKEA